MGNGNATNRHHRVIQPSPSVIGAGIIKNCRENTRKGKVMHPRSHGGNVPPPHGPTGGKDVGGVSRNTSSVPATVSKSNVLPPGPNPGLGGINGNKKP